MMAKYECENCGVMTDMLVGGECIKKCSSVVSKHELEELVSEWEQIASEKDLHHKETFNVRCDTYHKAAKELERVLNDE